MTHANKSSQDDNELLSKFINSPKKLNNQEVKEVLKKIEWLIGKDPSFNAETQNYNKQDKTKKIQDLSQNIFCSIYDRDEDQTRTSTPYAYLKTVVKNAIYQDTKKNFSKSGYLIFVQKLNNILRDLEAVQKIYSLSYKGTEMAASIYKNHSLEQIELELMTHYIYKFKPNKILNRDRFTEEIRDDLSGMTVNILEHEPYRYNKKQYGQEVAHSFGFIAHDLQSDISVDNEGEEEEYRLTDQTILNTGVVTSEHVDVYFNHLSQLKTDILNLLNIENKNNYDAKTILDFIVRKEILNQDDEKIGNAYGIKRSTFNYQYTTTLALEEIYKQLCKTLFYKISSDHIHEDQLSILNSIMAFLEKYNEELQTNK